MDSKLEQPKPSLTLRAGENQDLSEKVEIRFKGAIDCLRRGQTREALKRLANIPPKLDVSTSEQAEISKETSWDDQKLRKAFGLKPQKSLQEISLEHEVLRKEAVSTHLSEKVGSRPLAEEKVLTKSDKSSFKEVFELLETKTKAEILLKRTKALTVMMVKGIKNPEKIINILEGEVVSNYWGHLTKQGFLDEDSKKRVSNWVVSSLDNKVYKKATSEEYIKACKKLGNVPLACERLNQFGARFSLENLETSSVEKLSPMFNQLTSIPDKKFQSMLTDLQQYKFLFFIADVYQKKTNPLDFSSLISFMNSNAEITVKQRETLEVAKQIFKLGGSEERRSELHPLLAKGDVSLILANKQRLEDELEVLSQIILDCDDSDLPGNDKNEISSRKKHILSSYSNIFSSLDDLAKAGDLNRLAVVIKNGFRFGIRNNTNTIDFSIEGVERTIKAFEHFKDKELVTKFLFLEDLHEDNLKRFRKLVIGNNFNNQILRALAKDKETGKDRLSNLFDLTFRITDDPAKRRQLLGEIIRYSDEGIDFDVYALISGIKQPQISEKLSPGDKLFWNQMVDWFGNLHLVKDSPHEILGHFFCENQDLFGNFFQNGRLTDNFFKEFTTYLKKQKVNLFTKAKEQGFDFSIELNKFLLDPKNCPPCLRSLSEFVNNQKGSFDKRPVIERDIYLTLGTEYEKWTSLVVDGKININFISMLLQNNQINQIFKVNLAKRLITDTMIEQLSDGEAKFWRLWRDLANLTEQEVSLFLFNNKSKLPDFFQDGKLTPLFLEECLKYVILAHEKNSYKEEEQVLSDLIDSGMLDNFSKSEKLIWEMCKKSDNPSESISLVLKYSKEIKGFVGEDKQFSPELLIFLAKKGGIDLQTAFLRWEEFVNTLPEKEREFWFLWNTLPESGKLYFNSKFSQGFEISDELVGKMEAHDPLVRDIQLLSYLPEISKIKNKLVNLLLDVEDPRKALEKIKNIFEHNNLPDFAKKFRIFEIIFFTPEPNGKTLFDQEMENKKELSPILRNGSKKRRLDTIYRDLLRISIDSADLSLRSYLASMQDGQALLDKIDNLGLASLSNTEIFNVGRFLDRLTRLQENSLLGRSQAGTDLGVSNGITIGERIAGLRKDLQTKEGQGVVDRVSEMFVKSVGYNSIGEVLSHMDKIKAEAHRRNLSHPDIKNGQLVLKAGDLLKGVEPEVLNFILQGGSVAREYLGVDSDSDSTPFDTDLVKVMDNKLNGSVLKFMKYSETKQYGDVTLLIKDRGQFVRTDNQENVDLKYNPNVYEQFFSNVVSDNHFGIRTGFPSVEIDAMILTGVLLLDDNEQSLLQREEIFFSIANNGFYIPVVDATGKVIFTEEDFNRYKLDKVEIKRELEKKDFPPDNFVELLKNSPYLKTLYEKRAGVWKGYSTELHTEMVMSQFEKYFSDGNMGNILTREEFRIMLALHDIGKPLSVFYKNNTESQHDYTKRVVTFALQATGIAPQRVDLLMGLIDQDILGEFFKGKSDLKETTEEIHKLSRTYGVLPKDLLETLRIYYTCDAGSYTADAGGEISLDYIFNFKLDGLNSTASFSQDYEKKYQELIQDLK